MPNSLYNILNQPAVSAQAPLMGNMMQMVNQFQQFKQNFQGDPKQAVMNLVSSGRISQTELQQLQQTAQQLQGLFH